jgi:tetraacyldisaccharide 4'-kinase
MPCPVPIYYLRLEIEILRGASGFDDAVGRICFPSDSTPPLPPAPRRLAQEGLG